MSKLFVLERSKDGKTFEPTTITEKKLSDAHVMLESQQQREDPRTLRIAEYRRVVVVAK